MKLREILKSKKTETDEQIDEMQLGVADEVNSAIRDIDMALSTLELNGSKPEVAYRHLKAAKWKLKNLVLDLEKDTRL